MCAFEGNKVISDKVLLKKDGVVAYKILALTYNSDLRKFGKNYFSIYHNTPWINNLMTVDRRNGFKMRPIPDGTGPGIYAWSAKPKKHEAVHWSGNRRVVKVLLYGRVVKYAPYNSSSRLLTDKRGGYIAEKAEIIGEVYEAY